MVRKAAFMLLLLLAGASPAAGQEWAKSMFETTSHDFGTVARNAKTEYSFVFKDIWSEDVHVTGARASCGCTSVSIVDPSLKTYQKGAIVAKFNTDRFLGNHGATITVTFDKPYPATVQLQVKGNIRSDVVMEPGGAVLGDVDEGAPASRTITVTRSGRPDWKILEIRSANPHLSGKVLQSRSDGYRAVAKLEVYLDEQAPVGYIRDHLILVTNDPSGQTVPLEVEGRVVPAVTVSPDSLFLGVIHPGQSVTKQVVVRAKHPFRVMAITTDHDGFRLDSPAPDVAKPLHVIPLTFVAGNKPGKVEQTVRFQTDMQDATPELSTLAVVEP